MRHNDVDVRPAERHFGMVIGPKFPAELFVRHVVGSDRRVMRDLLCQALDIASDDFESLAKQWIERFVVVLLGVRLVDEAEDGDKAAALVRCHPRVGRGIE